LIGSTLSRYKVLDRLGGGGAGVVYKAQDTKLERFVALKFLSSSRSGSEADKRRFLREARAASALDHPHICTVYEIDETPEGELFIAMAFCEGETLKQRIERGPLPIGQAADLAAQIAGGLAAAHDKGIVHRDVKPANVMVSSEGRVKIVDFGIAKLEDESRLTRAGTAVGTVGYMAPEQIRGEAVDARTDVWALGLVLYEMLTGRPAFQGATEHELIRSLLSRDPEPMASVRTAVPADLERIVARALAKDPAGRYQRADAMRAELLAFLGYTSPSDGLDRTAVEIPSRPIQTRHYDDSGHGLLGRAIGHYRIVALLGGGGMGIVYKADDLRLARTVALKFLPPELTRDPEAKARFMQEARAASGLDHPNVCTIHEVGETDDGRLFLAMPCYDGETLRSRIERGPLPIDEATDIAQQIAKGLSKAHGRGIVHRDIKPANLVVTSDGVVKILDFGLAKLAGAAALTRTGSSIGTPAYMSPEQARGDDVDHRTDLWSLGVVLYEMVAGRRPFRGEHEQAVLYSLLNDEPKRLSSLRPDTPRELEKIVEGLLEKDPEDRYPTVDGPLADLRSLRNEPMTVATKSQVGPRRRRRTRRWTWAAAGVLVALLGVIGFLLLRSQQGDASRGPESFTRLTDQEGREAFPSLSPDGSLILYVKSVAGNADIYLQRVGGGNPRNLTEDGPPQDDTQPSFSPDGQQIAFRSERDGGGIFVMGATGESSRRLTDFGYNPAWSPDGRQIAFAEESIAGPYARKLDRSRLWSVDVATEERRIVSQEDAVQPSWSPDGGRIAYWSVPSGADRILWTIPQGGGKPIEVLRDSHLNWNPVWSPDGEHLFYVSDRSGIMNVWRVPIDQASGKVRGEPEPVTSSSQAVGLLSVSRDGRRMVYATDEGKANVERVTLDPTGGEAAGTAVPVTQGSRAVRSVAVSPDGQWLAFDTSLPREDIFVVRADGGEQRQLTTDDAKDRIPHWSPDGSRIVFYSNRNGEYGAWTVRPDGGGLEAIASGSAEALYNPIWAPAGRRLVVSTEGRGAALLDLDKPAASRLRSLPWPKGKKPMFSASGWSPDGRFLAGNLESEDGSYLPGVVVYSLADGTYERLTPSGGNPLWISGGRLLYLDGGKIFRVGLADREPKLVLSPAANSSLLGLSVSPADNTLYIVRETDEGDIWLLSW